MLFVIPGFPKAKEEESADEGVFPPLPLFWAIVVSSLSTPAPYSSSGGKRKEGRISFFVVELKERKSVESKGGEYERTSVDIKICKDTMLQCTTHRYTILHTCIYYGLHKVISKFLAPLLVVFVSYFCSMSSYR